MLPVKIQTCPMWLKSSGRISINEPSNNTVSIWNRLSGLASNSVTNIQRPASAMWIKSLVGVQKISSLAPPPPLFRYRIYLPPFWSMNWFRFSNTGNSSQTEQVLSISTRVSITSVKAFEFTLWRGLENILFPICESLRITHFNYTKAKSPWLSILCNDHSSLFFPQIICL